MWFKRKKIKAVLVLSGSLVCLFLFYQVLFAEKASSVRCIACHETGTSILPPSHKSFSMDNTNLCFGCHRIEGKGKPLGERLHLAHAKKSPDTMKDCLSCHVVGGEGLVVLPGRNVQVSKDRMQKLQSFFVSWMTSPYLDQNHRQQGLSCFACHSNYVDESMVSEAQNQCVKCHGDYDELIKKTAKSSYENNPHKSHLPDLKCSVCHHGHKAFEDTCSACHQFGYKAPEPKKRTGTDRPASQKAVE